MSEAATDEAPRSLIVAPGPRGGRRVRVRLPRLGVGAGIVFVILVIAAIGPYIVPHPINEQDLFNSLQPPVWMAGGETNHLLGTDALGRDTFSRLIAGTRNSIGVAGTATLLALVVGTMTGLLAGYFGGWFEAITMRLADVQLAFPSLLLAIALAAFLKPGMTTLIVILAIGGWVTYARVVRGTVLSLKTSEFVVAATVIGATHARIIRRHIFPNTAPLLLALAIFQFAGFIISEATLSFLGLGIQPPLSSWGGMLADSRPYLATAWWMLVLPGVSIMITVTGANLFSDAVRVWLDPQAETAGGA